MNISVFGLGYVGIVTSACFAEMGHNIIGVDDNPDKIVMINEGKSPIIEPQMNTIIKNMVEQKRLKATKDHLDAIQNSDISFISVGTPSNYNGSINLDYLIRTSKTVATAMGQKKSYHLIVIRSTVMPRSIDEVIIPVLEVFSGKQVGIDFGVCMNPEFLREGSAIDDFYHPPKTVIGQYDKMSGDILSKLYDKIEAPIFRTCIKNAEMIKYVDNSFHGLKISFANEIGNLCKAEGIDSYEIMDIFNSDRKLNLSPVYLKPEFSFGGSYIPKDIRALIVEGRRRDIDLPLPQAVLQSNTQHTKRGIEMILETNKKKIGILGMSFKEKTDDLRESSMVHVIETLISKGLDIKIYDKNVSLSKLMGSNKKFIEKGIPQIYSLMSQSINEIIEHADVIVIGNKEEEYEKVPELIKPDQIIIDLGRGVKKETEVVGKYHGICW